MNTKKKLIILVITVIITAGAIIATFFPVVDVNVIFTKCVNSNEIATVFQDTSFNSYQYYMLTTEGAGLAVTSNSELFGTPLEGSELDAALAADMRSTGIIVVDGSISLIEMSRIKKSPFVDKVFIYFPILDRGDRDIIPQSSSYYFDKHPEARYWE